MLYVQFLALQMFNKICNKGTSNVLQGGGGGGEQRVVKYHTFTFILDPSRSQ